MSIDTYSVKWYAELGYCDGGGYGRWIVTKESVAFDTLTDAETYLLSLPKVSKLRDYYTWDVGYGLARVRKESTLIEVLP